MSWIVETQEESIHGLVRRFIAEATDILDESKPYTRRVALLYKWSWILHGLGYPEPLRTTSIDSDEIRKKVSDMLKWVAIIIKNKSG